VLAGRFDVGILFPPGPVRGLETWPVHSESLCVALPARHPLAGRDRLGAGDLEGQPLIATPPEVSPTLRDAIARYCRTAGFLPTIRLETQMQQTIVQLVAEDLGIALVPECMSALGVAGVVFRPLENAPTIDHVIAWRPGNLNPALKTFLATVGVAAA
jgi:DNA-binding transcriptional LysR family regulator